MGVKFSLAINIYHVMISYWFFVFYYYYILRPIIKYSFIPNITIGIFISLNFPPIIFSIAWLFFVQDSYRVTKKNIHKNKSTIPIYFASLEIPTQIAVPGCTFIWYKIFSTGISCWYYFRKQYPAKLQNHFHYRILSDVPVAVTMAPLIRR